MAINGTTRALYWLALPGLVALTCTALGPYVGIPTALTIGGAAICAGVTRSRLVYAALFLYSLAYAGDGWADMQGKLQVARARQAELDVCSVDKRDALTTAREGPRRYRRWREGQAREAYQGCVQEAQGRYPATIGEIDPRNEALASARIAAKAGRELATAILVELTASSWGAALLLILGVRKDPKRVAAGQKAAATRRRKSQGRSQIHAVV